MTVASRVLMGSLSILVSMYAARYKEEDLRKTFPDKPKDFNLPSNETYDFIVVGAGGAGCIVARRLADAKFRVLLLEAGGNPPPIQAVPIVESVTMHHPDINFLRTSTPQKHAGLDNGGILNIPTGKMMGGSTSHNDMKYERGSPYDYDYWAKTVDDHSWSYERLLPFFRKNEKYRGGYSRTNQHGKDGNMMVTRVEFAPGIETWIAAGKELGYKEHDPNGPQQIGFSINDFNRNFGRRVSSYTGYIEGVEERRMNLVVRRYAVAYEVDIEGDIARGVMYTHHGIPRYSGASKEVIICAGALVSPLLLIKSGIGPEDQLKAANVDPIKFLPGVGENLMDHPYIPLFPFYVNDPDKSWYLHQNLTFRDMDTYLNEGKGPLTTSAIVGIGEAFIVSKRAQETEKESNWPDIQIYYHAVGQEPNSVLCMSTVQRQRSRGRVTLNTSATSMEDHHLALTDYNFFDDDTDFDVAIDGIEFCMKVFEETSPFQAIGARYTTESHPACGHFVFRSRDYWRCYVRQTASAIFHPSGTCKMGKVDDPMAVVDSQLRVHGIQGLRVVDASIMPQVTNANTAVATFVIAEKASSDIVRAHQRRWR